MRVLLEPERVALDEFGDRQHKAAEPALQPLVQQFRLRQIFEELLGRRDVLRPLRDDCAVCDDLGRQRLAVIAERQAHRDDVVVILFLLEDRNLG